MDIQKKYGIKAKKSLGQNFLKDQSVLSSIIDANTIYGNKIVEVGPGYGALSEKIVKQKPSVFKMIELDSFLVGVLKDRVEKEGWNSYCDSITIQEKDILQYYPNDDMEYNVIANIPYYITSPILDHFLYRVENMPASMTILMQKDVADKILKQSHHKKPKTSVLSLFITKKMDVEKVCDAPSVCFDPAPKVDSTVLHFTQKKELHSSDDEVFLSFIKKAFCEPRKKLISNLSKNGYEKGELEEVFKKYEISTTIRAEDVSLELYFDLIESLCKS